MGHYLVACEILYFSFQQAYVIRYSNKHKVFHRIGCETLSTPQKFVPCSICQISISTYLKRLAIIIFCSKHLTCYNCCTHDVFVFLSLCFVNKIGKWGASRHYVILKLMIFICFKCCERIEKHVTRPKHAQNLFK
jgi:hypothetical protein